MSPIKLARLKRKLRRNFVFLVYTLAWMVALVLVVEILAGYSLSRNLP